uniref:ABC transporter ATP-binding protein n=1 Tax=Prevotella sp. GTC17262 TaxID=3236797 RepID=A0AB33JKZ0_9BACT
MELQLCELSKIYGEKTALNIDALTFKSGEIIGLAGNNGAGKTTLLRLMLDLVKATTGQVLSNGLPVNEDTAWKSYTGSYIDRRFLIDFYTPEEYFQFIADAYNLDSDTANQRLQQYVDLMHDELLNTGKYLKEFSEGNRQKIGIIGAMLINPQVLMLDEPFNYLDPSSQIAVARHIKRLNEQFGTTVIISSHNLNYVTDVATRILLLEKGHIVKDIANQAGSAFDELNHYFIAQ